jgi:hypothetical protein
VFFSTGNFYFFLCLENNIINIPNLPTLAFYRSIQKGQGSKIYSYIESIPPTNIKENYEAAKDILNELLPQYEVNLDNNKLEFEITRNYYVVGKRRNKQTIKYRNKKLSLYLILIIHSLQWKNH